MKNNYKTEWNLGLLYTGDKDTAIERDLKAIETACGIFEKKYKKADYTATPQKLAKALADYEKLALTLNGHKPWWYFALKIHLNADNAFASAASTKFEQRLTLAGNKVAFFDLNIAKITKSDQKKFLSDPHLASYAYMLKKIFDAAKYNLTEKEEQLTSLLSQTSYTMWVDGQEKLLNQQTVMFKNEHIPVSQAFSILPDLPKQDRRDLQEKLNAALKSISHFAEAEINAVYNFKKTMDDMRGYATPYTKTVLGYENDIKTIEGLVNLVTKNFTLSRRFYKVHAKLLGEKKLVFADRSAKVGVIKKKFDFQESVAIVRNVFNDIDPKYATMLDDFLRDGQIDVYPRKGKSGGAFCWSTGKNPVYVLLNHTDDIRSVETLAHEMGHAIHYTLSKTQPMHYQDFTMSTAEVASTFFEQAVSAELEKHLSADEYVVFLHNKIMGDIATVFRQIACFNFEKELHEKIRKEGKVAKKDIALLLAKHMNAVTGPVLTMTEDDGYFFVKWSHIRNFFYVYSYAYGQLISRALYEKWHADPSYAKKIEQFLSAGGSQSPEAIFKSIGIKTDTAFFSAGLKSIERDIAHLEKLANKKKTS